MPIVRYQIRNQYGMADPELYGAAGRDDPEALLEGVAMAGLVGVLRQLGDLAQFAAEIFHDLHEQIMATSARGHTLMLRVQQLEIEFPEIEKTLLSQSSHSSLTPNSGINWHPNLQMNQNLVTQGDMPRFILNSYEECRGPPQLVTLDKFDIAGAGACLKRYSDPSFFKNEIISSGKIESEIQQEKKRRKLKKKGLRLRDGETLRSLMKPEEDSKPTVPEKVSKNSFLKRVKLKTRPVNSVNILTGRSYMESILYRQPTDINVLHEDSLDKLKTRFIETAPEVHEIMVDTLSKNSLPGEREQIQSSVQQRAVEKDSDRPKEIKVENIAKESFLIPKGGEEKFSIVGDDNNEFCGNSGTKGDNYYNHELGMKDSAETGSKTDGSADVYASDGIVSELDNYVDALTTMDSEIDTDTEGRAKPPCGLLNVKSQGMDSDTDEEHEHEVHLDSHPTVYSSGMLNCSSLCKENSACITGDCASVSADTQAPENNVAISCTADESRTHLFVHFSEETGENANENQSVCSLSLYENAVAKERDIMENKDDGGVHNVKELDELGVKTKFVLATYDSCIAESSLPAHGDPQAGSEENQSSIPYLKLSADDGICMFNGDHPDPQQFTEEQLVNAFPPSNHVGSTTNILEKFDVETVCSEDITDVLFNKSHMQSYNMEDSNSNVACSFIERETSADFPINNAHENTELKLHFVPHTSIPEEVIPENISNENFQELPSSPVQEHQCGKPYIKDNEGETEVAALVGEPECTIAEMLLRDTVDVPERVPQIASIQKPELEKLSDAECEMFHDANLQVSSSDNLQTHPAGSAERLDDAGTDVSMPDGAPLNLPTTYLVPETHVDAFATSGKTGSYSLTAENGDMFDSSEFISAVVSSQVLSVPEFELQGEFALQDSTSDQHDLERNMISCPQNDNELDSQKSLPSIMEGDNMVGESHDICTSMGSSINLNNTPKGDLLKHGEVNLSCNNVGAVSACSSNVVEASDVNHIIFMRLFDEISSVDLETTSQALFKEGIRELSAKQQHDDQQLEEAKPACSSDVSPAEVVIAAKKEIQASDTETDGIPRNDTPLSPDPHSSVSSTCVNYVDNSESEADKYFDLGKEYEVGQCFSERNQGSSDVSLAEVVIPSKKEIQASNTKTDGILWNDTPPSPDPHSSESPTCINYVDNSQSEADKYVNLGREYEVGQCYSKSNQGSSDVLPAVVVIPAKKEIRASNTETDGIPWNDTSSSPDPHSSESPTCINSVGNSQSEADEYVNLGKAYEVGQCFSESNQGSSDVSPSEVVIPAKKEIQVSNTETDGIPRKDNLPVPDLHSSESPTCIKFVGNSLSEADEYVNLGQEYVVGQCYSKRNQGSSDVLTAEVVIPAKKEIRASNTETDGIPWNGTSSSPDPHSSESPTCTNSVGNSQSEADEYVNLSKEYVVGMCYPKSNQGSSDVLPADIVVIPAKKEIQASDTETDGIPWNDTPHSSDPHSSESPTCIRPSVLPMATTTMVQTLVCSCSASVEATHSLDHVDASRNELDLVKLVEETRFDSAFTTDTSLNGGHKLTNGYNYDHLDIEDHFPSQSSAKLSARSMVNDVTDVDREPHKASLSPLVAESSFLHNFSTIQNDMGLDNASDQFETGTGAFCVCRLDSLEESLELMDDSNVLSHNECVSNHTVVEDHVSTQSSSETLLVSSHVKPDTPVQTSPSFSVSIPEFPSNVSVPVGYDQACSIPFPGQNVLERPVDEAPPLPPLPPLQWRVGKSSIKLGVPDEATALPSSSTPELVSDLRHGNPNLLTKEVYQNNPSTDNKLKSEDVSFKHDYLNRGNTRAPFVLKPSEGTNDIGAISLGGERKIPSESFVVHVEDQEYRYGKEYSNEAKRQQATLFVPVAVSCNETNQHVSFSFSEQAKPVNSIVLVPMLEHGGPQGTDPNLQRNLALFGSAIGNGNYHYSHGDLADERIQPLNIQMSSAKQGVVHQDNSFMDGGIDAYAPYSLVSVMDSGKSKGKPRSILNRPRDPLIEAVASHDKSTLRKVSEMAESSSSKPKVYESDTLLEQIRNKSFNLKSAVATKPNVNTPSTNLKVAAILEKANAIRQAFVGSDEDDDDNWSDC